MTLRGTFRDGVIIPEQSDGLRDGDVVDIVRKRAGRARTGRKATSGGAGKKRRGKSRMPLFGFGLLKDKREWRGRSTVEIAAELKKRVLRRAGGA